MKTFPEIKEETQEQQHRARDIMKKRFPKLDWDRKDHLKKDKKEIKYLKNIKHSITMKKFAITLVIILTALILTNPTDRDFKSFTATIHPNYPLPTELKSISNTGRTKNYILFSIYTWNDLLPNGNGFDLVQRNYYGIGKNFFLKNEQKNKK